jgi:hypothetical protein
MSDLQSGRRKPRVSSAAGPTVSSRDPEKDLVWSGKTETHEEQDARRWFLEDIWGKQDDEPKTRRGRRE